jgi:hypothetical protein
MGVKRLRTDCFAIVADELCYGAFSFQTACPMNDTMCVIQTFETHVRKRLPELAAALRGAPDVYGNFVILDSRWTLNSNRCHLGVLYRPGDCFEISFSVAEARGPAERQILLGSDLPGAISAAADFLRDIVSGRVLVDVLRYRFLWFRPYYLAFFREASQRPRRHVVETLCWTAKEGGEDMG